MLEQNFILSYPPSVNKHLSSYAYYDKRCKLRSRQRSTEEWRNYLSQAAWEIIEQKRIKTTGEVEVIIDYYPPDRRRRDTDNILKAVFDALTQSGVIEDDYYIFKHSVERKKELLNKVVVRVIHDDKRKVN